MGDKRVFISYSRVDHDLVQPVVAFLRATQADVFVDVDSIEPGDDWSDRLESALQRASLVFIFWCQHSSESEWVQKEWTLALRRNKRLIPVLLDSTPLPRKLGRFKWIDCRYLADRMHLRDGDGQSYPRAAEMAAGSKSLKFVGILVGACITVVAAVATTYMLWVSATPPNLPPSSNIVDSYRSAVAAFLALAGLPGVALPEKLVYSQMFSVGIYNWGILASAVLIALIVVLWRRRRVAINTASGERSQYEANAHKVTDANYKAIAVELSRRIERELD